MGLRHALRVQDRRGRDPRRIRRTQFASLRATKLLPGCQLRCPPVTKSTSFRTVSGAQLEGPLLAQGLLYPRSRGQSAPAGSRPGDRPGGGKRNESTAPGSTTPPFALVRGVGPGALSSASRLRLRASALPAVLHPNRTRFAARRCVNDRYPLYPEAFRLRRVRGSSTRKSTTKTEASWNAMATENTAT